MNFFERQATARRTSRRWVLLFIIAVIAIVAAVDTVMVIVFEFYRHQEAGRYGQEALRSSDNTSILVWTTSVVLAVIAMASLYKSSVLRAGGSAVAKAAGGQRVDRNTNDAAQKRLLNIVEEMAIASGVPMPEVYVLEQETGINAFAAGHTPANAAIAVTRGALEKLTRSELQGVIAHEFSHLLNGDMRLNIKLMGLLFGIMMIALAGRFVLRVAPRGGGKKGGGAVAAVLLTALAIMIIGYVGLFFGRLIQAAVARNRESLADASAVQFTRDPLGLRGALVKVGASGSTLRETQADEIAHMLFAPGMARAFATHPPLVERLRAIDPTFRESEFDAMRRQLTELAAATKQASESGQIESSHERLDKLIVGAVAAAPAAISQLVGNPSSAHFAAARSIFASLPDDIVQAVEETDAARGLFFALALDDEADAQTRQLNFIGVQLGTEVQAAVRQWLPRAAALQTEQRQPALLRLFPALRRLSQAERAKLLVCATGLLQREGRMSINKYALRKLAQLHLRESLTVPPLPGRATLDVQTNELALLFSVLARAGTDDVQVARQAYESGMATLFPRARPEFAQTPNWPAQMDLALNKLDRLLPAAKELVVQALVKTIAHDAKLTVQEGELLRAVCATLHCPLPPLLASAR